MKPYKRFVIVILGLADGRRTNLEATFLFDCDVEAREGRGTVRGTPYRKLAMKFDSPMAALEYWKRSSVTVPVRPDGLPNKPFTGYNVTVAGDTDDLHDPPALEGEGEIYTERLLP